MNIPVILFLLLSVPASRAAGAAGNTFRIFDVKDYGAVSNGKADDSKAFQNAWAAACSWEGLRAKLVIPKGRFLVGPLVFGGPCKAEEVVVQVRGQVLASSDLGLYTAADWISFRYVNGLLITGRGRFDGAGASVWHRNRCHERKKGEKNCKSLPWSINLSFVTNSTVRGITSVNSKGVHMQIFACKNLRLHSLKLIAPEDSPNTDGIHIGESANVDITRSTISTGDDCISIGPGTANLSISRVFCGPGHGISIGSLGGGRDEGDVTGISVRNCTFAGTTNGVRIKTWQESPTPSAARDFVFEDLVMKGVDNPIIIDQKYCPHNLCNNKTPSLVKISNVKFRNIRGETRTRNAISLVCSRAAPCEGVELSDIELKYAATSGEEEAVVAVAAAAFCSNVKGSSNGIVIPPSCI